MREHVHTGPFAFLFAGISALVFFNVLRLIGIWAADKPGMEWLAGMIGGAINFTATMGV